MRLMGEAYILKFRPECRTEIDGFVYLWASHLTTVGLAVSMEGCKEAKLSPGTLGTVTVFIHTNVVFSINFFMNSSNKSGVVLQYFARMTSNTRRDSSL